MCMGKLSTLSNISKSRKTHSRFTFYAARFCILCIYAGSNLLRSRPEIKNNIFTLIHVSDVLARTLRAGFLLEFNFFFLCAAFSDHRSFVRFVAVRGWKNKKKQFRKCRKFYNRSVNSFSSVK